MNNVPSLNDVIKVYRENGKRIVHLPTIAACHQCGGCKGISWEGKIQFPELAAKVELISYGYNSLGVYDSPPPEGRVCECDKRLQELQELLKDLPCITNDSGWIGKSGGRCITDYTRQVEFASELSEEELQLYKEYLRKNKCPGWTGIGCFQRDNVYTFKTTWDSSG